MKSTKKKIAQRKHVGHFVIPRKITLSDEFKRLTTGAKVLFFLLCDLQNYFSQAFDESGCFAYSDEELMHDSGLGRATLWRARKSLKDAGLILYWPGKQDKTKTRYIVCCNGQKFYGTYVRMVLA